MQKKILRLIFLFAFEKHAQIYSSHVTIDKFLKLTLFTTTIVVDMKNRLHINIKYLQNVSGRLLDPLYNPKIN